jgi:uncharacterized membrane protein (DUF106 family)
VSIIGDVFGAGGVASLVQTIIEKFVPDPQAKAAALQQLQQNQIEVQKMQDDLETKLNDIAGQNIRADAQSGDKFTSRARPLFMYIVEAILAFNYIGLPIFKMCGASIAPMDLPPDLLVLFGTCITGYVFARSTDKALSLPGDSQVNVAGILKLGNKQ